MSKYTNHAQGLVLGWDNIFFLTKGPEGLNQDEFRDGYRATVWAQNYEFDQINSLNVFVLTPAQQIIWHRTGEPGMSAYTLSGTCWSWLLKHVGRYREDWDVRPHSKMAEEPIFFKKRKDALAFVRFITTTVKGCSLPKRKG